MPIIDFDAFRAERKSEPLTLTVGGKSYDLPPSLPAALAFELLATQKTLGPDGDMDTETVARLGSDLFGGQEQFQRILAEGRVTMDELPDLLELVLQIYQGGPQGPNRATRRAQARRSSRS